MNRSDFHQFFFSDNWDHFYEFADTHGLADGDDIYHSCKLCPYETRHIEGSALMERIDRHIEDHLWTKHYYDLVRRVNKIRAKEISSKKGQTTLEGHSYQERLF